MRAEDAVEAPRVHWEDEVVYTEPGDRHTPLEADGRTVARFRERNLFFGGAQAAARERRRRLLGRRRSAPRRRLDRGRGHVRRWAATLALTVARARRSLGGCGLDVQLADLFLLTRTGQGSKLTHAGQRQRHDPLQRRQAEDALERAADPGSGPAEQPRQRRQAPARSSGRPGTRVHATRSSSSRARSRSRIATRCITALLAQVELFAAQAAQQACGLSGCRANGRCELRLSGCRSG